MRRVLEFVVAALLAVVLLAVLVSPATNLPLPTQHTWLGAIVVMLSTVYAAHQTLLRRARIYTTARFYGTFYLTPYGRT
jgi:phosphate/sulfate permease